MRLISKPVLCNYYLTYRCNAKCGFCDIWEKPSPYASLENIERNMLALKKLGVKVIDFTGGEPLLHRQIDEVLSLAKKLGFITTLTSNAMLYKKWAAKIKGKVDMLHFSIDASTAAAHDASRGVACFDLLQEAIAIAVSLGEKPDLIFTVHEGNMDEIAPIYEQISYPNKLVLIINPIFSYQDVAASMTLQQADYDQLAHWSRKKLVYLNHAFIKLRKDGGNHIDNPVCKAASSSLVISPQNELVLPCYHLGEKTFPIDDNLFDLYHSDPVRELIALEGKLPACEGCTINCYMQPSFAVELNKYWWAALPSTIKYNMMKGTWKAML